MACRMRVEWKEVKKIKVNLCHILFSLLIFQKQPLVNSNYVVLYLALPRTEDSCVADVTPVETTSNCELSYVRTEKMMKMHPASMV